MGPRPGTLRIRQYIIQNVSDYPAEIAWLVSRTFGISRQAVNRHLRALQAEGIIEQSGQRKGTRYALAKLAEFNTTLPLAGLEEDIPWTEHIRPRLDGVKKNVLDICHYGFTEILNNAIDHSESTLVRLAMTRTATSIELVIDDYGVGIFKKIRLACGLQDDLDAALELAKGKLTTDPAKHTGEGIFFTSRAFDRFVVLSGQIYFSHIRQRDDWLLQDHHSPQAGTLIRMQVSTMSTETVQSTFDRFSIEGHGGYDFSRTHVPVQLMQVGGENLVSRSQAKRLLTRFSQFKEVLLDFKDVDRIGQAFADEVFRVYRQANPEAEIVAINMCPEVEEMVTRAQRRLKYQ